MILWLLLPSGGVCFSQISELGLASLLALASRHADVKCVLPSPDLGRPHILVLTPLEEMHLGMAHSECRRNPLLPADSDCTSQMSRH